jgi:cystathionine gamma-lyase
MSESTKDWKEFGFSTRAIHAGQEPAPGNGAIMTPIYQTSTFVQESPGVHQGFDYSRADNPTRTALENNLASLEHGKHGACFASGCAGADAVLHLLTTGSHVVSMNDVYGGTYRLFEQIYRPLGLDFSYADLSNFDLFEGVLRPDTKLVWIETPTNPLLKLVDIERIASRAHEVGAIVVVDNTFASPYLQNPLAMGADIVLHSSTKYLGGHSDIIGGVLITNDDDLSERIHFVQKSVGGVPGPIDCFMLLRSTKTLALRMERHCENAEQITEFLCGRNDIEQVIYPGHPSHPQHELCKKQMKSGGGMITMILDGGVERAKRFLEAVEVFALAESLGGVESLIEHPAIMTHASIPAEVRAQIGISDGLVRLSVGVENLDDLLADLKNALDVSK